MVNQSQRVLPDNVPAVITRATFGMASSVEYLMTLYCLTDSLWQIYQNDSASCGQPAQTNLVFKNAAVSAGTQDLGINPQG